MDEQVFLQTMIETIKHDNEYPKKSELLAILRNSKITYDQTNQFATKSYQCWEYIDLRVPIPMLNEARVLKDTFQHLASDIYIETDEYDFKGLKIKPKPISLELACPPILEPVPKLVE